MRRSAEKHPNIRYFGFVSQEEALSLQGRAATLINPRSPEGLYTRYSFPSKTLEYLRSGRPTLCYALEGIPEEYGQYLIYIQQSGADGIRQAVQEWLQKPAAEREARGTQRAGVCTAAEKSQGAMQRASLTAAAYGVGADNGRLAVRACFILAMTASYCWCRVF